MTINNDWPEDFPPVTSLVSYAALRHNSDPAMRALYDGAKNHEDREAAAELIDRLVSDKDIGHIKAFAARHPGAVLVSVHAIEGQGRNAIPQTLAHFIAEQTNLEVDESIVQSGIVSKTGVKSTWYRLAHRTRFEGTVQAGKDYILVDDAFSAGGTFSELRQFIEQNGGKVVDTIAMANGAKSMDANLAVTKGHTLELERKFGVDLLQDFLKEESLYGGNYKALTDAEARTLLGSPSLDRARDQLAAARQEGNRRVRPQMVPGTPPDAEKVKYTPRANFSTETTKLSSQNSAPHGAERANKETPMAEENAAGESPELTKAAQAIKQIIAPITGDESKQKAFYKEFQDLLDKHEVDWYPVFKINRTGGVVSALEMDIDELMTEGYSEFGNSPYRRDLAELLVKYSDKDLQIKDGVLMNAPLKGTPMMKEEASFGDVDNISVTNYKDYLRMIMSKEDVTVAFTPVQALDRMTWEIMARDHIPKTQNEELVSDIKKDLGFSKTKKGYGLEWLAFRGGPDQAANNYLAERLRDNERAITPEQKAAGKPGVEKDRGKEQIAPEKTAGQTKKFDAHIEAAKKAGYVQGVCECAAAVGDVKMARKLFSEMKVTRKMAKEYARPGTYKALEQDVFSPPKQEQRQSPGRSR